MDEKNPYSILGFKFNPFPPATSTKGYYFTPLIRQILDELFFGITTRKGIMALVGEVGVGKTSLLLQLLNRLEKQKNLKVAWIFNTFLSPLELLKAISIDFGLTSSKGEISTLLNELHQFFIKINEEGGNCAIIVDEAHNLSEESLETLRMLSNLEIDGQKLVQIVLVGQSELNFILNEPKFRQLRSRIQIFHVLEPLSKEETINYINYKLATSGGQVTISKGALNLVYKCTLGNLRMLHLIMDRAIHILITKNSSHISSSVIKLAAKDVAIIQKSIGDGLDKFYRRRFWSIVFLVSIMLIAIFIFMFNKGLTPNIFRNISKFNKDNKPLTESPRKNFIKEEVNRFLGDFKLDFLAPTLLKAIEYKDISFFKLQIPNSVKLIVSNKLPDKNFVSFSYFPWKDVCGVGPKWLILWKSPLNIDKSFPNRSPKIDILVLQTMLKELGFYQKEPDGKFGPSTLEAVIKFQRQYVLPQTHGVDDLTLLWICSEYEKLKRKKKK